MGAFIVALFAQFAAVFASEVFIGPGQIYRIQTEPKKTKDELLLKASPGSNIRISCDDFRLPIPQGDDPCKLGMVKFGEIKYCDTAYDVALKSKGNTLLTVLDLPFGGYIDCVARSTQEPEDVRNVQLEVEDGSYSIHLKINKEKPYADVMWVFTSSNRLSASCVVSLKEPCVISSLFINDGEETKEYCVMNNVTVVSKGNRMSVRAIVDKYGEAYIRCLIQSVTGPHAEQLKNMISEEVDSREHGVTRGKIPTTCNCGWVNKGTDRRVLNGKTTKEGEYPYMVSILQNGRSICGGSIITKKHVLTAAHCVLDPKTRVMSSYVPLQVVVGGYDLTKDSSHGQTQKIDVNSFFIKKEWLDFSRSYDISVLLLASDIKFSQFVGPVCLPNPDKPYKLYYKRLKITGWGLNQNYETPEKLQTTRLFVLDRNVCPTAEEIICTYSRTTSICYGDSGGPYVYLDPDTNRYTQISVNSFTGKEDCVSYSGSANVTYHFDWIRSIVDSA